jgi:hypothetical protein
MADFGSFVEEFLEKLRYDRLIPLIDNLDMAKKYGVSHELVSRMLEPAESSGIGFRELAFVCCTENAGS